MSVISVDSPADLPGAVGRTATGEWYEIAQERINQFADATDDHQWIHIDAEKAAAGPFGTTIAHGFLTLSLLPHLASSLLDVGNIAMGMNYGLDKVRFLAPVPSGSRVRATTEVTGVTETSMGMRVAATVTIELEGSDKPALVAESLSLYVPAT